MKSKYLVVCITVVLFALSFKTYSQNYFNFNGAADVLFRFQPRGSGGRALVHDSGNILSLNYGEDFTGGVRIWGALNIRSGNNYFNYNGGADVTLKYANRGSGGRAMIHNTGNALSLNHNGDFTGGTFIGGSKVIINQGNVGIGTSSPDAKLTVKGNIHTNEVKVDLLGAIAPDYVFYENYNLRTLKEVENYITEKGHLPNIPSAEQMEEEGIKLKEMNLRLLEKIEELTLYTISQEKRLERLESKNENLILLVEKLLEKASEE